MNDVNAQYITILNGKCIETDHGANFKKHLKDLLSRNVPDVEFVASLNRRESHRVTLKQKVSEAVGNFATSDIAALISITKLLRHEVLDSRKWRFRGDFSSWKNPPLLEFLLKQIVVGPNSKNMKGKREDDSKECIDLLCQMVCQNTKSDRQIILKSENVFKQTAETPFSIGFPMAIHSRSRDYHIVKNLNKLYIGSEYRHLIDLEKRIEFAVLDRMSKTGWYCLPDFVRKGVHLWFAVDNIDFLECTAYGQNTLHGTILVLFQRNEDGELINPPLKIPMKLPANPVKMKIQYCDEPEIKLTPIRFKQYAHGFGNGETDLKKYSKFTKTWALASFAGNGKVEHIPERLQKVIPTPGTMPAENESTSRDENVEDVAIDQEDEHAGNIPVDGMNDDRIIDLGEEDMDIEDNN